MPEPRVPIGNLIARLEMALAKTEAMRVEHQDNRRVANAEVSITRFANLPGVIVQEVREDGRVWRTWMADHLPGHLFPRAAELLAALRFAAEGHKGEPPGAMTPAEMAGDARPRQGRMAL